MAPQTPGVLGTGRRACGVGVARVIIDLGLQHSHGYLSCPNQDSSCRALHFLREGSQINARFFYTLPLGLWHHVPVRGAVTRLL